MFFHQSKLLKEEVVILEPGEEYHGPKVSYYRSELAALADLPDQKKIDIHNIKKTFNGAHIIRDKDAFDIKI